MSLEIIYSAILKGAELHASVSGGKDGQAMVTALISYRLPVASLIHADLGRIEWHQSIQMCRRLASQYNIPLHVVRRTDQREMVDHWKHRLAALKGTGKPFWSSSASRYCTSDMKRAPINKFLRNCGSDFVISCEGLRGQESKERAKKQPLHIRKEITSTFYDGMSVEEAIEAYTPGKRLALDWYPIFHFTTREVWETGAQSPESLERARIEYIVTGKVPHWWSFHPAYVYGNERVSCVFCVLGSINDLKVGAQHRPELLAELIGMEEAGEATFKHKFSLNTLIGCTTK